MKKHKGKIQMGIVIGIFSAILITCLISVFSQLYTENKEKEEFRQLAEIVTEETTDATLEEIVRKPNLLKVSDSDNEVQSEQPMYYTTDYQPHSISELTSMNSDCFGWVSIKLLDKDSTAQLGGRPKKRYETPTSKLIFSRLNGEQIPTADLRNKV